MSGQDWALGGLIILGVVLFLYGSNYYDNIVSWTGVLLVVGGILTLILQYVYKALGKRKDQKSIQTP